MPRYKKLSTYEKYDGPYKSLQARTEREAEFIQRYVATCDPKKAAILSGYSERNASDQGAILLKKPYMQSAIAAFIKELQLNQFGPIATAEEVLAGYTRDIRFDPRKLYDENGKLKKINDLDDNTALALVGIEQTSRGVTKLKLPDKKGTRDSLARHFGLFVDKVEVNAAEELKRVIAEKLGRLAELASGGSEDPQ